MGLKAQLTIVAAATLLLPWAGCQYIRESEQALRLGQQELLLASARSVAAGLAGRGALGAAPAPGALYLHALKQRPLLDGYGSDWLPEPAAVVLPAEPPQTEVRAGVAGATLLLHVRAAGAATAAIDVLLVDAGGKLARFRFSGEAPGLQTPAALAGTAADARLRGYWEIRPGAVQLEAQLPLALAGAGLGVATRGPGGDLQTASYDAALPPAPIAELTAVARDIERYRQRNVRIHVVDAVGWVRAEAGSLGLDPALPDPPAPSFVERLYRPVLDSATPQRQLQPPHGGRDDNSFVRAALAGTAASDWLGDGDDYTATAIVAAAAPITTDGAVVGAVVMQQNAAGRQLLTNSALTRLATITFAVVAGLALVLFGYAVLLSLRIRRLAQAADTAMDARGRLATALPSAAAGDEIGSLSRSFSTLLGRVADYNEYLKALAGRLSHELRTPLSVVSSSLDNLEAAVLSGEQRDYAERAREGVSRLERLLRAMSEATRVEQIAAEATRLTVDLAPILATTVAGYADAWPERNFRLEQARQRCPVVVAPELIVQLLDKFVDNAVSFSSPGDTIRISLRRANGEARVTVTNPGPPLPAGLEARVFESLVSVREGAPGRHLGFGLYIARLIAEAHDGTLGAGNTADGSGVAFSLRLPLATVTADTAGRLQ